ncbi:hypothetical protein YDYSG_56810 [Paenibacillus tyrfis]|nr:hypothetical protein YDYSG_56810 [Paenibacillus tyrfis]
MVKICLNDFNKEQTLKLLDVMNTNSQIWRRKKYDSSKDRIRMHCQNVLGEGYDYSEYSNLNL